MTLQELLQQAVTLKASDIFIVAGCPVSLKINGRLTPQDDHVLKPADTYNFIKDIYETSEHEHPARYMDICDDDFSFSLPQIGRFRVNIYKQRGSLACIMRVVLFNLPNYMDLGIPETVMNMSNHTGGLVLVTGPSGSGKSTTLACIIDRINKTRHGHVMTLEDPIEFLHRHNKSIVSQREISTDTDSYVKGLKAALRQAPDVILIGEMRDAETISTALTAAETGHLVLSTLHTLGAANVIDRIIDSFPSSQQSQVRIQLSMVLQSVISQQLLPSLNGGRIGAFEIMIAAPAVRNLIREAKLHQLESIMFSGKSLGMQSMDQSLAELFRKGYISRDEALSHYINAEAMTRQLSL